MTSIILCKFNKVLVFMVSLSLQSPALYGSQQEKQQKIDEIVASVPQTKEGVELFKRQVLSELDKRVAQFLQCPDMERNFENTVRQWHEILALPLAARYILEAPCIAIPAIKDITKDSAKQLMDGMSAIMNRPEVVEVFLRFLESHCTEDSLLPSQRAQVCSVVKSLHDNGSLPVAFRERIERIKKILFTQEQLPYTYLQGDAPVQVVSGNSFSVFSFNTCFVWDRLPMVWGGPLPWEFRMDEIVDKIKEENPDILCLQEVYDQKAAAQLYQKLRGQYRHFYCNIGPRTFGLSTASFGLSSGLFVASRYEIENPQFIAFGDNSPAGRTSGFFDITVMGPKKPAGRVLTTHLHPFENQEGRDWREKQMKQIVSYMQEKLQDRPDIPYLLCGDLNTELNNKEPAERLITQNFFNAYGQDTTEVTFENRTRCDYRNYWWLLGRRLENFTTQPKSIDYALLLHSEKHFDLHSRVVSMSDPQKPEDVLSDHQALLSTLQLFSHHLCEGD